MKRILLILFAFICVSTHSQVAMMSGYGTTGASWDTTGIFSDGNTLGWYIADVENYTTVGDTVVSQWDDLSGNGMHLTSPTSAYQPHYAGDSIWFDGVDDRLRTDDSRPDTTTVYMVIQQLSTGVNQYILRYDGGSFRIGNNDTKARLAIGAVSIYISEVGFGKRYLWTGEFIANGTASLQIDDGTPQTNTVTSMSSTFMQLGESSLQFSISELIIRHEVDSDSDQEDIRGYLNSKYSLY